MNPHVSITQCQQLVALPQFCFDCPYPITVARRCALPGQCESHVQPWPSGRQLHMKQNACESGMVPPEGKWVMGASRVTKLGNMPNRQL